MTQNEINFEISTIRMQIYALECGHDNLSRADHAEIEAMKAQIAQLQLKAKGV